MANRTANAGRLEHKIAGLHHERLALILIDHADPALADGDDLECELVKMDPVGHRAALVDADRRGDVASAEAARDQVTIGHPGAPCPAGFGQTGQHEFWLERWEFGC